ncbi:hypothetical protein ACUY28_00200 [Corynebacterium sanguinis]
MSEHGEASLEELVDKFVGDLTRSLNAFAGECPPFKTTVVNSSQTRELVNIRFDQSEEAPGALLLKSRGQGVLSLAVTIGCTWDSASRFLAVEKSSFAVYPYDQVTKEPLFRVEYVRGSNKYRPSSHFHVHAHRDEFTHLMSFAAKVDVEKQGKLEDYFKKGKKLSSFHFPTGGHRFRPCMEDILEVLRVEFDLNVKNGAWAKQLKRAREDWRRIQTAAVVRDCPEVALKVLVQEYGMPAPTGWACPETDVAKLTRS